MRRHNVGIGGRDPYIDKGYYRMVYRGMEINERDINILLSRASDIIDEITGNKIQNAGGLSELLARYPGNQQEPICRAIKMATAAQTEYLDSIGGVSATNESSGGGNVSIGSYSVGRGSGQSSGGSAGSGLRSEISPAAIRYLAPTGLLYTGVI